MTYEEITESLKAGIKSLTGFPAFLLPQNAKNNTAHIDLLFQDSKPNGEDNIKIIFLAEYRTNGTHAKWLTRTIELRQKLHAVEDSFMEFEADHNNLRAYWISLGNPQWVYPSEEESSMPAEYVMQYRIEIDIPTRIITEV